MQQVKRKCGLPALVVSMAMLLAAPAMAEGPSYNFVQATYQSVNLDFGSGFDVDGDGFGLGGSFEVGESVFIIASYATTGFDFDVDLNQLQIGLGYHAALTDNTDFFATLAYVDAEVEGGGTSVDDSGYGASIGVRSNVSELVELFGEIAYVDFGDDSDTAVAGEIWFNLTDNFALGLGASAGDDVTSYGAGARFYFGK